MDFLKSLFGIASTQQPKTSSADLRAVEVSAQSMLRVINESLSIANKSTNPETRISRTRVARDTLHRLEDLCSQYPAIHMTNLAAFRQSLAQVEAETGKLRPSARAMHTVGLPNEVIYYANLTLDTPLKFLALDGARRSSDANAQPDEEIYGIWSAKTATWRELGVDIDEMPDSACYSQIGQVKRDDYLQFLVAVRTAAEGSGTITERIVLLKSAIKDPAHAKFVRRHGGQAALVDVFFPPVLASVPGINCNVVAALKAARVKTIAQLKSKTDKDLLAMKGVGPGALQKLRTFADTYTGDDKAERGVAVQR